MMKNNHKHDRLVGALVGLAVGDAIGTTLEFKPPGSFDPITDMMGGGPFHLSKGEWTDDTSMALCLAESLLTCEGFSASDQMNRYCRWQDEGYLSSNGRCFDIGITVSSALRRFRRNPSLPFCGSSDPYSAGNGGLMRLAPVVMFFANNPELAVQYAIDSTRTTHGASACLDASADMAELLLGLFNAISKDAIMELLATADEHEYWEEIKAAPRLQWAKLGLRGTGYVVESYNAARFCFFVTDSFEDAVLLAANLGDDADTTAAIVGQLAGAFYGLSNIPSHWRGTIAKSEYIHRTAARLASQGLGESHR
ncbi:ADP-ribosylglycohydrolase family protein [Umboniibacter marinipuniceus]|uniref:ADP-ribosyl-[dinitrogen reductase] hydrolase n=1 Tax=Umboniibacter marinipuniceus TaxID=569599 RepID=A0A3M0ADT4_9GAMM|nr:ADP-ribosylglycohydrolase family protein [Umboniibacter marinipuniceus]RMA82696.1 ADP-ribosyl-[dinitrogen reductase] hydrolase [Umboniibacter marinipuniceus]